MKLLLAVQGKHREEVERAILIVCQKSPEAAGDRAKPVLAVLAKVDPSELPKYLPLLGRLGGPQVLRMIDSSLASEIRKSRRPRFERCATGQMPR